MKIRNLFATLALACLLLSQQLGIAHAVSHLSADPGNVKEKQLPAELQCEQCLAYAAFGSGLATAPAQTPVFAAQAVEAAARPVLACLPVRVRAFDSRAPPASL